MYAGTPRPPIDLVAVSSRCLGVERDYLRPYVREGAGEPAGRDLAAALFVVDRHLDVTDDVVALAEARVGSHEADEQSPPSPNPRAPVAETDVRRGDREHHDRKRVVGLSAE